MGRRIAASITRAEDTFYRVLRAAQVEGAVDPRADVRAIARFLVANTHGLSALAKAVADIAALRDVVGVILRLGRRHARRRQRGREHQPDGSNPLEALGQANPLTLPGAEDVLDFSFTCIYT